MRENESGGSVRPRNLNNSIAETVVAFERFGWAFRDFPIDEETRRGAKVLRQRQSGRTGGGPECPMCGERRLEPLRNSATGHLYQCFECKRSSIVRVAVNGISVEAIAV